MCLAIAKLLLATAVAVKKPDRSRVEGAGPT